MFSSGVGSKPIVIAKAKRTSVGISCSRPGSNLRHITVKNIVVLLPLVVLLLIFSELILSSSAPGGVRIRSSQKYSRPAPFGRITPCFFRTHPLFIRPWRRSDSFQLTAEWAAVSGSDVGSGTIVEIKRKGHPFGCRIRHVWL